MLELTTRFDAISTSPKAGQTRTPDEAAAHARANLRYISRRSARDSSQGRPYIGLRRPDGTPCEHPHEVNAAFRAAIDERARKGKKNGIRVAEKIHFSLPNDFDPEASNEAISLVLKRLAKGSKDVKAIGVNHTDRPNNNHAHIILIDGLETVEQARKRRPDAKRVRRQDVVRMGDLGQPKKIRALIAKAINDVAKRRGLSGVEHRSFKERGLGQPTWHEGTRPRRRDTVRAFNNSIKRLRATKSEKKVCLKACPVTTYEETPRVRGSEGLKPNRGRGPSIGYEYE